jgi:hypothetical protein
MACVTGVPRDPASGREMARISQPEGRTPPETLEQVNQQYLKSKYKFKEGALLKEYLQQRIPSFREPCTLVEVLTWLKEIIRDNLLFDKRNPAMIVGDAPLEAALKKKEVHVNKCGDTATDDGRGQTGPMESGHAYRWHDTFGKNSRQFTSRGPSSDGPSWCSWGQGS